MPPSAITGTSASAQRRGDIGDRGDLRHADAGDDARGADRARADADLDRVRARIDQRARASAVTMLPAITCVVGPARLDALDGVEHAARVAVRGVDHHHVDAGLAQRRDAVERVGRGADRGADAQPAALVLAGARELGGLLEILDRDHADAARGRRSTTSTFSMRCLCRSVSTSSLGASSRTVTRRSFGVMTVRHRLHRACSRSAGRDA